MPTLRSQLLSELLPVVRAGIRPSRLRACYAEEALQQTLIALIPHVARLEAMGKRERDAYVFMAASRKAMAVRKRVGLERARGSEDEVSTWEREVAGRSVTPEDMLRAAEGAEHAARAFEELPSQDKRVVAAVNEDGLSERDAAGELGMSRGSVAYRLRRARDMLSRAWLGTTSWAGRPRRG
ncbi:sigma-70 family RNA polymerase sigma factor [Pendulispora brunnea]|uniref:Sigma-70 family RNA polymerase sigma factor n=1 Tax=Pendulispora brunnea TaxID=2905690 RepID=A0ABZ2K745_9BACT